MRVIGVFLILPRYFAHPAFLYSSDHQNCGALLNYVRIALGTIVISSAMDYEQMRAGVAPLMHYSSSRRLGSKSILGRIVEAVI